MSDASDYVDEQCQVCGKWFDFCLITTDYNAAGLCCCTKNHHFCSKHATKKIDQTLEEGEDEGWQDFSGVDPSYCPICHGKKSKKFTKHLTDEDLLNYLLRKTDYSKARLKADLTEEFKNGEEFFQYLKGD